MTFGFRSLWGPVFGRELVFIPLALAAVQPADQPQGRRHRLLRGYLKPDLLIIDEVGLKPLPGILRFFTG